MSIVDENRPGVPAFDSGYDTTMLGEVERKSNMLEIGVTGLKRSAGYIDEEFLPQLRGRKAVQVYKEMSENDPLVGALLFVIDRLLRNLDWRVDPAGKGRDDMQAAKFLEGVMDDMEQPWDDFISEALSMLVYGWSWHEIVYKRRVGRYERDPRRKSQFSDNLIGLRKLPIRAQETLLRWVFDDTGETLAMVQMAPPRYATTVLPKSRSMLFRYRHHKGNPEGVSMLRNAYRPWFMKKRLEEFEAVGVERDLAGLPIVKLPAEYMKAKPGSEQAKTVEAFKKLVRGVRRNEQEGVVFPISYDQDTKQPLYSFELMGGGGARAFNTDAIIRRYEERILMSVLADFILVGHQGVGSYSMHTDKSGIFRTSLNSIAQNIANELNSTLVPRLFLANGWKPAQLPKIVPNDVDNPDLGQLSQFMGAMSSAGVTWFPDGELENFVREAARLPKLDEEELNKRRQLQMRAEATQFAQGNIEYLTARQQMAAMLNPQMAPQPGMEQPGAQPQPGAQQAQPPQHAQQRQQGGPS